MSNYIGTMDSSFTLSIPIILIFGIDIPIFDTNLRKLHSFES